MAIIYSIVSQKGGTGKTTTAAAIAAGARLKGKKSLLIDLDPQANLSIIYGLPYADRGIYELLTGQGLPSDLIQETTQGCIIPAGINSMQAQGSNEALKDPGALKAALKSIRNLFDIIVIDTPPTASPVLINAIVAADQIIIPAETSIFGMAGIKLANEFIKATKRNTKAKAKISGVLITNYNARANTNKQCLEMIRNACATLDIPVFDTCIRSGTAARTASTTQRSIFDYDPNSKPAIDYMAFIDELGI